MALEAILSDFLIELVLYYKSSDKPVLSTISHQLVAHPVHIQLVIWPFVHSLVHAGFQI